MRCTNEPTERRSLTSDQVLARPSAALDAACGPAGAWTASAGTAGGAGAATKLGRAGTAGTELPPQAGARRDDLPSTTRPAPVEAMMTYPELCRGSTKGALEDLGELPHPPAAVHGWMAQRVPCWIDALAAFPVACTRSGNGRSGKLDEAPTERGSNVRPHRMRVGPWSGAGMGRVESLLRTHPPPTTPDDPFQDMGRWDRIHLAADSFPLHGLCRGVQRGRKGGKLVSRRGAHHKSAGPLVPPHIPPPRVPASGEDSLPEPTTCSYGARLTTHCGWTSHRRLRGLRERPGYELPLRLHGQLRDVPGLGG